MTTISERSFEEAIEASLTAAPPDGAVAVAEPARAYGEGPAGGYRKRTPEEYDRHRSLIPREALDFVYATQPKEWERLTQHHGAEVKERFLARVSSEIAKRAPPGLG